MDLDFGLLVGKYSFERVLVMVVAGCATAVGHVYVNRAFGCCRTLTPVCCLSSILLSFFVLFFLDFGFYFYFRFGGPTSRKCCGWILIWISSL